MGNAATSVFPARKTRPAPSTGDIALLESIGRFGVVTAEQLTRLHTPTPHGLRSIQRRLKRLVDVGLLLRLRAHPTPRYGSAPHVFALAQPGRGWVARLGIPVPAYFRPGEQRDEAANLLFVSHTLAVVDVLISAYEIARDVPAVSLGRLKTERELKHQPLRVAPDPAVPERTVAVIPDAWFELRVAGRPPVAIAVELDRGSEHQTPWRRKVAALISWATGPYKQAFQADNITIAVVAPTPDRVRDLREWTSQQIRESGVHPGLAEIFLFASVDPAEVPAEEVFFLPLWVSAGSDAPVSLLDSLPVPSQQVRTDHPSP